MTATQKASGPELRPCSCRGVAAQLVHGNAPLLIGDAAVSNYRSDAEIRSE